MDRAVPSAPSTGPAYQLLILPVALAGVIIVGLVAQLMPQPMLVIGVVGGFAALAVCIVAPKLALHLLVLAFLLSPEFALTKGQVGAGEAGRAVTIRAEDVMLAILLVGWALRMGIRTEVGVAIKTPINFPIFVFVGINVLATALGILGGQVNALTAFFFCLKYIEYYLFFFIAANLVETREQVRHLFITAIVTCVIVCMYGYYQIPGGGRITTPFEGEAEPNTLGGYLVFMLAFILAFFLETHSDRLRILFGGIGLFATVPLLYTLSRGSYVAMIPMAITILMVTRKKLLLTSILVVVLMIAPFVMPGAVLDRISDTFYQKRYGGEQIELTENVRLDTSATQRVWSWGDAVKRWLQSPIMAFLGAGATGVGFVDAQYVRVLCETGAFGITVFLWLLYTMYTEARSCYQRASTDFDRGLALGYLGGLIGLFAHGLFANTFIVIRIMEPFWFMTALVLVSRRLQIEQEETLDDYLAGAPATLRDYRAFV